MKRNVLTQYLIITASCALYAVGFNWMFDPNHISVGGFTGLGQIINYLLPGLPIGTIVIILNVPLFVLGWRFIGKDFLFSSVYATAVSSLMIDGLAAVHTFKPMEPILACLYGGVIIGVSCGIMLREGATTGGTELAARLLKLKLESLSIGTLCLAIDILVTVTYALIFRDLTRALYGMISLSLISVSIDKVVYGPNAAKVAYIISDCHEELTRRLLELDRGVTLLQGKGAYSGKDKQVILCACARTQIIPREAGGAGDRPRRLCHRLRRPRDTGRGLRRICAGRTVRCGHEKTCMGAGGGPTDAAPYRLRLPAEPGLQRHRAPQLQLLRERGPIRPPGGELSGSGECPAGADQRRGQGGNHLALPRRQRASRPAGGGAGVSGGAEGDAAGSLRRGVPDLYGGRDTSEL